MLSVNRSFAASFSLHSRVEYPISTDDLIHVLERIAVLDQFAELKGEDGKEIWGVTEFAPATIPVVKINAKLSSTERFANPFRTTLTHEFAHVKFHGALFELKASAPGLFNDEEIGRQQCRREQVESPGEYDWAEWQAAYCSGALLMPISALRLAVTDFAQKKRLVTSRVSTGSTQAEELIAEISGKFAVSSAAARVRLIKLGFLKDEDGQKYLLTD